MAFAVADSAQGRGIGTRLLEQLARRAREHGITRFVADVLASNRSALGVFADAGFEVVRDRDADEVELRFAIAPTVAFEARVEQRDHTAVVASLRPFFEPASVAVIGASRRRGSIGGELFRNILDADFSGAAYPVNRGGSPVAGVLGTTTLSPGTWVSQASSMSECWAPNCMPPPAEQRKVTGTCVCPPDM